MHVALSSVCAGLINLSPDDPLIQQLATRYPLVERCNCPICTKWQQLPAVFGLDPIEIATLGIVVSVEFDAAFGRVYSGLVGAGQLPTVSFIADIMGTAHARMHGVFSTSAPLAINGLIELNEADSLLSRSVACPVRLIEFLCGVGDIDPVLAALVIEADPMTLPGVTELAAAIGSGEVLCYVQNPPGAAGVSISAAAARELELNTTCVDLDRLSASETLLPALRAAALEAGLSGSVLVVSGLDEVGQYVYDVLRYLARIAVPVVALGPDPWDPAWNPGTGTVLTAQPLTFAERNVRWRAALKGAGCSDDDDLLAVVSTQRLTPEQIRTSMQIADRAVAANPEVSLKSHLLQAVREVVQSQSSGALHRRTPKARLSDLVLPEITDGSIRELIGWARHRDKLFSDPRILGKAAKGTGLLAMFTGPPGTGKTLAAEVVASELGFDLQTVDLSAVVDKYIGETEKHLEQVFRQAEQSNCVLFFDEADALFGARSGTSDAKDRYANQEIAYLLQRMEAFDGLAILATNLPGNLDAAFQRRLHFIVRFLPPDDTIRRQLWAAHLDVVEPDQADPFDWDELAGLTDLAGGDIRNIVLAAAFSAEIAGQQVGMKHLRAGYRREMQKLGRRL